jgi:hypothetical protein
MRYRVLQKTVPAENGSYIRAEITYQDLPRLRLIRRIVFYQQLSFAAKIETNNCAYEAEK